MQHSSRGECLPSNTVCKACSQKVEKLLNFESSVSSILSIQALALTATIQAPLAQRAKRASISSHPHLPSKRPALEDSRLTPSTVSAKTTSSNETLFQQRIQCRCLYLLLVFTTLQNYHAFANPHFRVHSANLVYVIEITCWTI